MEIATIQTDLGFTEGPVAVAGGVAVCSITHGAVYVVRGGRATQRIDTGGGPNGMAADADGSLYVAQNGGAWGGLPGAEPGIQRIVGDEVEYLVTGLDAPNDICFGPDGRLYITDPGRGGLPRDPEGCAPGRLYSCAADGSDLTLLHEGLKFINGLAFDPSATSLYIVESATRLVHRAAWQAGAIGEPEPVAQLAMVPDGMAVDSIGRLYVAVTRDDAVEVLTPEGVSVGRVELPEGSFASNCCFGGDDLRTLYVTAARHGSVLEFAVDTPGLALNDQMRKT